MPDLTIILPDAPRLLLEADLKPLQGSRFQPTGFPDIGAARYELPKTGTPMVLVESAQSVANRLEGVCWDDADDDLVACLRGLPYVRVLENGKVVTSSIQEAHRLNSVYIERSDFFSTLRAEVDEDGRFDRRRLARALLKRDPNSLIHGVFLESINGLLRLPRLVSGFVEAANTKDVDSGGVKNDRVNPSPPDGENAAAGYGNVPFHRSEFTAERITGFFSIDLSQLRSYGLGEDAERLLFALSLWKILRMLETGMRLRTACDLEVAEIVVTRPAGFALPGRAELEAALPGLIAAVAQRKLFAEPAVTAANYSQNAKPEAKTKGKKAAAKAADPSK
ncbi:MAG: type I-U CRISPR-associated protein Cas7 [Kofleriaceae bacterium]|jgi:CRISPR-associated protein Csb1|nr:type I-U CRISPR-associated protein Cas7 [Kofleriaceae bacterium]MBP9170321.1 type I-U CRISPR-associated protein Cas7 [Kofleriaceae bacterium]MBP9860024.1 type I-U CRISPR-associated protein Cas7 [Kofleriaceae bacterium]